MQFSSSARATDENVDYLFKVILIGDSNVGKTCVVQHFKSGVYTESQQNTIGVDFTVRSLEIDGKKVKMQVWDTAGQERFRTITQSYYRSAHAAIIAYDLTRRSTFESVPHWIREIEKYGAANLVIMLIGRAFSKQLALFDPCLPMLSLLSSVVHYKILKLRKGGHHSQQNHDPQEAKRLVSSTGLSNW
ncbi:Ras-related protein Rab-19 [Lemmus lemmus]